MTEYQQLLKVTIDLYNNSKSSTKRVHMPPLYCMYLFNKKKNPFKNSWTWNEIRLDHHFPENFINIHPSLFELFCKQTDR